MYNLPKNVLCGCNSTPKIYVGSFIFMVACKYSSSDLSNY